MPRTVSLVATVAIFVSTLVLATLRPRRVNEAWWTCLGAVAMLALGLVHLHDVVDVLRSAKDALLFLLALLLLAALLERSGFFDWAAIHAARRARGDAHALYRNVFLLGAGVTAVLSLDTTAVILTPLVLAFVERLRLPARPYVLACAFVANTGSLLLPISNLTNLLFVGTFGLTFTAFGARMVLPQIVALTVTFAMLRWLFRRELPRRFATDSLPEPSSVVANRAYFHASIVALLLVCVGYFVAPAVGVRAYVPAFLVAALLAGFGLRSRCLRVREVARHVGWSVFPFVIGLFVVVRGVENLGFPRWASPTTVAPHFVLPVVVAAAAAASNVVNNLPTALLVRGILVESHGSSAEVFGALVGTNIGPNVLAFGSLATILVLGRARARGHAVGAGAFFRVGVVVTPVVLAATTAALALTFLVRP